jgi:ubiquitin-like 1-activating enzyme E1 A
MGKARVLYVHVTGVSSEILKNLVLAGIRASICDPRSPDQALQSPSFFLNAERECSSPKRLKFETVADAVKSPVELLNPLLDECEVLRRKSVDDLTQQDVQSYTAVVASRITMAQGIRLCRWVTGAGGAFYHVDTFGLQGACAVDLGPDRKYRPEKGKELLDETSLSDYVPLQELYKVPFDRAVNRFHKQGPPAQYLLWRSLLEYVEATGRWPDATSSDDFCARTLEWVQNSSPASVDRDDGALGEGTLKCVARVATAEIAPVCSVLGGLVGNEIIKTLTGKGEPANNTLLFDGTSCKAYTFLIKATASA